MKIFILSRRFLIPFFIVWVLNLGYFTWYFRDLYGEDLKGKGIPSSFIIELFWHILNSHAVLYGFLAAFLAGTAFCFHQVKKKGPYYHPFSTRNWLTVCIVAILGFVYSSFAEPVSVVESRRMLMAVVWARPGERPVIEKDIGKKDAKMMTLPELMKERKAIAYRKKEDKTSPEYMYPLPGSVFKWVDWQIGRDLLLPVFIFMFYFLGALTGFSMYRTYGIWVLLLSYFVIYWGWSLVDNLFYTWYRYDRTGLFVALGGPVLFLLISIGTWYLIPQYRNIFRNEEKRVVEELFTRENKGRNV